MRASGYEFQLNPKQAKRLPTTFSKTYHSKDTCITRENFRDPVTLTTDD